MMKSAFIPNYVSTTEKIRALSQQCGLLMAAVLHGRDGNAIPLTILLVALIHFPTRCPTSFSFSSQTYSINSVSGVSVS